MVNGNVDPDDVHRLVNPDDLRESMAILAATNSNSFEGNKAVTHKVDDEDNLSCTTGKVEAQVKSGAVGVSLPKQYSGGRPNELPVRRGLLAAHNTTLKPHNGQFRSNTCDNVGIPNKIIRTQPQDIVAWCDENDSCDVLPKIPQHLQIRGTVNRARPKTTKSRRKK
jgi:hypothetical protein